MSHKHLFHIYTFRFMLRRFRKLTVPIDLKRWPLHLQQPSSAVIYYQSFSVRDFYVSDFNSPATWLLQA